MKSAEIEKWVKIRAVLDMITYTISEYKHGRIRFNEAVNRITNNVSEVFGHDIAKEVARLLEEIELEKTESGEVLSKIQEVLVKKVIEGDR